MKRHNVLTVLLLFVFVLAACSPQVTPVVSEPVPAAVDAARQALAERLGISVDDIEVVNYEQVDWSDGCLGLGGPAESCLAAITPGYAVTLEANGEQYAYRTDLEGTAVREETQEQVPAAVDAARQVLAERLGISVEEIAVVDFQQVDWSDGCLGLGGPAESCLAAITPGYAVTLEANGEQYNYRTDLEGTAVREETQEPVPAAVDAARQALAERLGISVDDIEVVNYEQVDWSDGCLGLGGPAELCLAAITPGYAVTLEANGEQYNYRTNLEGTAVRADMFDPTSAAVDMARHALAERLGVTVDQVELINMVPVEWPDSCLGLPAEDELCAMVITSGYEITLQVEDQIYVFHTNEDGSSVREAPSGTPPAETMRDILAQRLGVSLSAVEPVAEESVEWSDACLGVHLADVMCAEVITPGYRLVYNIDGEEYVIHTNQDLSSYVVASAPVPDAEEAVIVWEERDGGCSTVLVDERAVAYGPCDGELMPALFATNDRIEELRYFIETFRSFEAETEAGVVTLRGEGEQEASEVEQRAVAEWSRTVFMEASEGQSDQDVAGVLEWQREGGIAGFCDTLQVSAGGFAVGYSCKSDTRLGLVFLSPEELEQVYAWHENLMPVELEQEDDAVADAMTIRLRFSGNGLGAASEQEQQAMLDLANDLFDRITMNQ